MYENRTTNNLVANNQKNAFKNKTYSNWKL